MAEVTPDFATLELKLYNKLKKLTRVQRNNFVVQIRDNINLNKNQDEKPMMLHLFEEFAKKLIPPEPRPTINASGLSVTPLELYSDEEIEIALTNCCKNKPLSELLGAYMSSRTVKKPTSKKPKSKK